MKTSAIKNKIRRGNDWKNLRQAIFERQKGICPFCNNKLLKGFNVHHKDDSLENYGNFNNLDNFVALHRGCHKIIEELHRKKNLPLDLKRIVDSFFEVKK
jgi:5-methylcytosine-specific restriction endonuclease McrA